MTENTEGPILVRCWAFNIDGLRCGQLAGHDGKHAHAIEWSDAECYSPIVHQLPTPAAPAAPPVDPTLGRGDEPCLICGHDMHRGRCTGMDGEFPCDCANGV